MSDAAFEACGVKKRFGRRTVLDGLDLAVRRGETFVLLGSNGVGKTTLLRAAFGLLPLDGGTLRVAGIDVARHPIELRRAVGYVPDVSDVPPWMSLDDLFRFLAPLYPTWDAVEGLRLAQTFDLPRSTPFRALSRGQSTKALLAAALAPRPQVLLMDEPFGGLDPTARDEVTRGVVGALRSEERTVVFTTHDLDVAARVADRVGWLKAGRIARIATIDELVVSDEVAGGASDGANEGAAPRSAVEALRAAYDLTGVGGGS